MSSWRSTMTCMNCEARVRGARKYCSKDCLYASMRLPEKRCHTCGILFRPEKSRQKFCSLICYNRQAASERLSSTPDDIQGSKWIPLTQGKFALVDESKYPELIKHVWCAVNVKVKSDGRKNDRWYAKRVDYSSGTAKSVFMHRFIINAPEGYLIDHANGNSLDNRAENLRIATKAQNAMNSKSIGRTGYKGVSKTASGKFAAKITANWRSEYMGLFNTAEEAAEAYDKSARRLHGQFARLNFPRPGERSAILQFRDRGDAQVLTVE